jgi:hypothetical protein
MLAILLDPWTVGCIRKAGGGAKVVVMLCVTEVSGVELLGILRIPLLSCRPAEFSIWLSTLGSLMICTVATNALAVLSESPVLAMCGSECFGLDVVLRVCGIHMPLFHPCETYPIE